MAWKNCLSEMNVTEWAFYDIDQSGNNTLLLLPPSPMQLPISRLINPKEIWIFFPGSTDFVAVEITADWSQVTRAGNPISGGEMYAFNNFQLAELPQTRPAFSQWSEQPHYWAKTITMMPLNETNLLIINKEGITAVMIKTWEGGVQDNSISVNRVYTNNHIQPVLKFGQVVR
jgi:hypothetical protein